VSRIEYLLKIEGLAAQGPEQASKQVPAGLLEEVFALNEELDEIREARTSGAPPEQWRARLERARQPIERKRDEHESQLQELSARWDALASDAAPDERRAVLHLLRDRFLERNYITNLLAGIERELAGPG
jgi:molecular chaperone HscB